MPEPRVIVIGSGVAGASTAFALALGGADVTVVDTDQGGQATAAGAGIVQPWSSAVDGPFYDLYAAGAEFYPTLVGQLGELGVADVGHRRTGSLVVNPDPEALDPVAERLTARAGRPAARAAMGDVERLDGEQARELFPPLAPALTALHVPGGARVDGRRLRDGLLHAATLLGARIRPGHARLVPATSAGRSCTPDVMVDDERYEVDVVVAAGGAWTPELLAPLGRRLAVHPQRGQITHLGLAGTDTSRWPSLLPLSSHYLLAFDDSRVVVGATRETGAGFDARVTAQGQHEVLDNALRVAPGLATATLLETRVGLRPASSDGLPFLGSWPDQPGLVVNAGFGAAGLTMAPYVGHLLATQVLGGPTQFDLSTFAPDRPCQAA
jgi:D-amino-acid dehydrogenase